MSTEKPPIQTMNALGLRNLAQEYIEANERVAKSRLAYKAEGERLNEAIREKERVEDLLGAQSEVRDGQTIIITLQQASMVVKSQKGSFSHRTEDRIVTIEIVKPY